MVYVWHRAAHEYRWYRPYHDIHHIYSVSFSWAGTYLHPFEILSVLVCQAIPIYLFQCHTISVWMHMCMWTYFLDEQHSDYDVPWSLSRLVPAIGGGASQHAPHHIKGNCNYGFVFTIWDKLCGTYIQPPLTNPYVEPYKKKWKAR